ncbi:MAG: hypothetical protein LH478_14220 [Chitinophagaceae bacterium]|nr:hypothetical protein [Chitinophagaceae bacterium]
MKRFLLSVILLISFYSSKAQYYYYNDRYYDNDLLFEIGGSVGTMNAITDIGGQGFLSKKKYINEINGKAFNKNAGIYLGANYKQVIGVRLELTYGSVSGSDSFLVKGTPRFNRNLSYKSDIREISLLFEFHPLILKYYDDGTPSFSPYVIAGGGWFSFNPQGKLNNQWVDLQPLHLEGQGFPEFPDRKAYKLSQPNLCGGVGVRYEILPSINLRLEFIHRYLFTDYLDDVSKSYIDPALFNKYLTPFQAAQARQLYKPGIRNNKNRGESKNTDSYFTVNFKLGMTLGRTRR